ncbi:MAG TPA: sulfatase, partial [Planctomycetota bacterium]|nr:sulfatase [Planctomycetota bacterium]
MSRPPRNLAPATPPAPARLLALALAAAAAACGPERPPPPPPPTVTVEVTALDIVSAFASGAPGLRVIEQTRDMPLQAVPAASLDKSTALASDLDALVIAARAESAFELEAGPFAPGARLRARTMVYSQFRNDAALVDPAPATFRILVDGRERAALGSEYVREVDGHEHPYDQLMRTLEIPLDEAVGRAVKLRFETTRHGASVPADAIPAETAWWELAVVQPVEVERQLASPARPNLLVLVVDTLAAGRMSLYGYARDTTPNLKAFASRGMLYEAAVAPSSWTLPATASLLTGLPPNTHGVLGDARSYLMDGLQTWPELLRAQGLEGAAFVANPLIAEANNFHQGFGHWRQANDARAAELNARLLAWIDGQPPERRWFAYVHYIDPHAPYGAPGDERERFCAGYSERRDFGGFLPNLLQAGQVDAFDARGQQHVIDLYDAEVSYFDRCFGELQDELQRRGLLDQTIVVLTADHGEELFEHGRLGHGYALYEELTWVPLVAAGPGLEAGARRGAPLGLAALAATLAAWG